MPKYNTQKDHKHMFWGKGLPWKPPPGSSHHPRRCLPISHLLVRFQLGCSWLWGLPVTSKNQSSERKEGNT